MENIEQLLNDLSDIFDNGATCAPVVPVVHQVEQITENKTIDIDLDMLEKERDQIINNIKSQHGRLDNILSRMESMEYPEYPESTEYPEHPKHKIINEFIMAESKHGIAQGSEEWHKRRAYGVGGSQISTIMGINAFTTLRKYIYEKLGLSSRDGALRMWWGILFEDVIAQYVEKIYNSRIFGANMFIDRMPLYYSPDGLMIIDNEIVLLEFKSLYSRIPNKHVPEYYVPQPKMGLEIIKIADYSLFIEAVFRRCQWNDMNSGKLFDKSLGQKNTGKYVLAYGFMLITRKSTNSKKSEKSDEIIDYGSANVEELEKMFYNACMVAPNARWDVKNSSIIICGLPAFSHKPECSRCKVYGGNDDSAHIDKLILERNNMIMAARDADEIPVGILPWKLIRADFHKITREPGFLNPYMEKIINFGKCVVAADQYPINSTAEDIRKYKTMLAEEFLEKYDTGPPISKYGKYGGGFNNDFVNVDQYMNTLDESDDQIEGPGAMGLAMEGFVNFSI